MSNNIVGGGSMERNEKQNRKMKANGNPSDIECRDGG
jgi:hypothetical protein